MKRGVPGLRSRLGALLLDRPRLAWPLFVPSLGRPRWLEFRNRRERIVPRAAGDGFECDWRWTSNLNIGRVFPSLGSRLLRRALASWPIDFADAPQFSGCSPKVSFIVGHRGIDRLPLLLTTLRTLFAQRVSSAEVLVVEQDAAPRIAGSLPAGARHLFTEVPAGRAYSRSAAFNAGARAAIGRILVFHDNDTLAPAAYASELVRLRNEGYPAMRLQRFVFYLDRISTDRVMRESVVPSLLSIERIVQNTEGGTLAIARDDFHRLGGFDETFVGWGGEDNEFFDRCRTLPGLFGGYLPFVHLFHDPQAGRLGEGNATLLEERLRIPPAARIARLCSARPAGR